MRKQKAASGFSQFIPILSEMYKIYIYCLALLGLISSAFAGLLAYGICQTGCNALAVACYTAAGATFGTVTAGAGVPAVILGCNAA